MCTSKNIYLNNYIIFCLFKPQRSDYLKNLAAILTGLFSGFANGLFGSGGGTVAVPAMENFLHISAHKSHATAIALILPLSAVSAFIYIFRTEIPWNIVFPTAVGSISGGIIGAKLLKKISSTRLHKIFALFMLAAAIRMIL